MKDFDLLALAILISSLMMIGFVYGMHTLQEMAYDRDIQEIKDALNQVVKDMNTANLQQNNNIEKLCGAIEGCEYGD